MRVSVRTASALSAAGGFLVAAACFGLPHVFASASGGASAVTGAAAGAPAGKPFRLLLDKSAQQLASDLHLTPAQLRQDLQKGESLDEIAVAQGVSEQQLEADVKQIIQTDLSKSVQAGYLTQAQADRIEQRLEENLPKLLQDTNLLARAHALRLRQGLLTEAARIIGIPLQQLEADLRQGQSLVAIAKARGVSEDTLVQKLAQWVGQQAEPRLRHWVEATPRPGQAGASGATSGSASATAAAWGM